MYLFGGHDGSRHLNDVHVFSFDTQSWATMKTEGSPPIPRDSHVAVSHGNSMFVFGGSTGSAMNDFHELRLDSAAWAPVKTNSGHTAPCPRFCHVAVSYNDSLFIFGARGGFAEMSIIFFLQRAPKLYCIARCGFLDLISVRALL